VAVALVAGVAALRLWPRGEPTPAAAVERYLAALERRDADGVRAVFTRDSSGAEIARRLRVYGGAPAAGATYRVFDPVVPGAPRAVEITFPRAPDNARHDAVSVRHGRGGWLLLLEPPWDGRCAPGSVCDAVVSGTPPGGAP
jgi:hypothetical protein